ncbi:MAG: guanylate kinase [Candidatus Omnitrophica bacterium]|nr:guanylate kinase [Candidatus Omnitrophota bacterium]
MAKGRIVIISGPSGSGKTTLYKMLLESPRLKGNLVKSISATTRSSREGEKHGREYLFISLKMFQHKINAGHFLESQKVFDNYYGTPKKVVKDLLAQGKHVLLCIDVKGAKVVQKIFPNAITVFIRTRSLSVLKRRLESRGQDDPDSRELRLKIARSELKEAKLYDFQIINDRLDVAYKQLEDFVANALVE